MLENGIAFGGVSRHPARVKCALLDWMAWKDATALAVAAAFDQGVRMTDVTTSEAAASAASVLETSTRRTRPLRRRRATPSLGSRSSPSACSTASRCTRTAR